MTRSPTSCQRAAPRGFTARWCAIRKSPHTPPDSADCPATNILTCSRSTLSRFPGTVPQEVADAIHAEIERLKKEDISDDELKMIKTRTKANLIRGLAEN